METTETTEVASSAGIQLPAFITPQLILSIVIIVATCILMSLLRVGYRKLKERRSELFVDPNYQLAATRLYRLLRAVLVVMAVLFVLQVNNVDIGSLATGFGIAGIVVAFAVQDLLSDLVMGARIVSDKFFQVGDVVRIGDVEGTVTYLAPRCTKIRSSIDGSTYTISNRNITNVQVMGTLVDVSVPLSYDASLRDVDAAMNEVVARVKFVEGVQDASYEGTRDFGSRAAEYLLRFHCDPHDKYAVRRRVLREIQETLQEFGLEIPYDRIDLRGMSEAK
ncbi:MAG: mechanosensitive ion channel family protein [Coriobacteriales bacterium]|nr:mechanosensitive ion channel family protein [Coriobacteriales bacterium]